MINIDFNAGGITFSESKDKVYFCAILETTNGSCQVTIRHFLASDDEEAESLLASQTIANTEAGISKNFSEPKRLKNVIDQLNMVIIDEGSLNILEED